MAKKMLGLHEKSLECPDPSKTDTLTRIRVYVERNKTFPPPCNECYTLVLYSSKEHIPSFNQLIRDKFRIKKDVEYEGIWLRCRERSKERMMKLLQEYLKEYKIEGRLRWRRCCKTLEREFPYLFKNSKTFLKVYQARLNNFF